MSIDALPSEVIGRILARLTRREALQLEIASKTLHALVKPEVDAGICRPRLLVSSSRNCKILELDITSGTVVRSVCAYRLRKKGARRLLTAPINHGSRWITSMVFSPYDGDLYASQYKVAGVEQYAGNTLAYKRILVTSRLLSGPEGLAFSKNHLYVASAVHGHIARITLTGQIMDVYSCKDAKVPWGMCVGPDENLYITVDNAYQSENYGEIPPIPSCGHVSQIVLHDDGSFAEAGIEDYTQMLALEYHTNEPLLMRLARPSGLCFDSNGHLFVTDIRGEVYKFQGAHRNTPASVDWDFELIHEHADQPIKPWDVCVIQGRLFLTSHTARRIHNSKIVEYDLASRHFRRNYQFADLHECNMFAVE